MPRIVTTFRNRGSPAWQAQTEVIDRSTMSGAELLRRLVRASYRCEAMLLNGSIGMRERYVDLVAAGLVAHRRKGPAVVVGDCTWGRGSTRSVFLARKLAIRAIDSPRITYCVLSTDELRLQPATWGLDPRRFAFTPYYHTVEHEELELPTSEEGGVFAGGEPERDYELLVAAARQLDVPVTLATSQVGPTRPDLSPNVRAGRIPHAEFVDTLRRATVVVVPLKVGITRSAGQQTYLNAMVMGKLVVVTDSPGVRDYIEHGRTGLIVPAEVDALASTLRWALDPSNRDEVRAIGARASEVARARFGPDNYVEGQLRVIERALASTVL